ncbi:hypothetical protein J6590_078137 [Homalodisca vitripennis]|nr:hypothetical protein J6590_078137 [Homalodisca vitripennis]
MLHFRSKDKVESKLPTNFGDTFYAVSQTVHEILCGQIYRQDVFRLTRFTGLPIIPRDSCLERLRKSRLGQRAELHESFICAGGQPGKDTCKRGLQQGHSQKGNGGSPLVCPSRNNPNVYVQAGIVVWALTVALRLQNSYSNNHVKNLCVEPFTVVVERARDSVGPLILEGCTYESNTVQYR